MTKDEAKQFVIKRWRALPLRHRQDYRDAIAQAEELAASVQFHTMGDQKQIILAWLIKELEAQTPPIAAGPSAPAPAASDRSSTPR